MVAATVAAGGDGSAAAIKADPKLGIAAALVVVPSIGSCFDPHTATCAYARCALICFYF